MYSYYYYSLSISIVLSQVASFAAAVVVGQDEQLHVLAEDSQQAMSYTYYLSCSSGDYYCPRRR